jgi:branched-chain amino acid transport system substrate-binding protein
MNKIIGVPQEIGVEAAVAYLNATGGVLGHHINLVHETDGGDPSTAVSDFLSYISSHPLPADVVPGEEGNTAGALIPVVAKHPVFAVSLDDGNEQCMVNAQKTCPNEFSVYPPENVTGIALTQWFQTHHDTHVGILEAETNYTEAEGTSLEPLLKKAGIPYTLVQYPSTTVDLTSELSQLKSAGADVVYSAGLPPLPGVVLKSRAELGWNVPVVIDDAGASADITKLAPAADLTNAYEQILADEDPKIPMAGRTLLLKYSKGYGNPGQESLEDAGIMWDTILSFADAAKQAGSLSVSSLDQAMLSLNPAGDPDLMTTKEHKWTASDHENLGGQASDFPIIPVGPVKDGEVY